MTEPQPRIIAALPQSIDTAAKRADSRPGWCYTCGNPVQDGKCACWCLLADALQRYLGMDFDGSAQMAADLWDQEADRERVWAADYADDHDVPVYPPPGGEKAQEEARK